MSVPSVFGPTASAGAIGSLSMLPLKSVETDDAGRTNLRLQFGFSFAGLSTVGQPKADCFCRILSDLGSPPPPGLIWCFLDTRPGQPCLFDKSALQTSPLRKDGRYENMKVPGPPRVSVSHGEPFQYMSLNVAAVLIRPGGGGHGSGGADVTAQMPVPPPETSKPH